MGLALLGCAGIRAAGKGAAADCVPRSDACTAPPREAPVVTGYAAVTDGADDDGSGGGLLMWRARRALERLAMAMDAAEGGSEGGCSLGNNCFAAALTLTDTLTGVGATFSSTVTSTVSSGTNAFAVSTNGGRVDLGTGANDYLFATGGTAQTAGDWTSAGTIQAVDYRVSGTNTFDLNSHVANAGTGYTFDISTNLTSGTHTLWRDNATTTLATLDFEGKYSALRLTSTGAVGDLGLVLPNGVYACFNSTTCTSFMRYDNSNADLEITGGTAVTIAGATTLTTSLKIGSLGTATSAFMHDSESVDFGSLTAPDCADANTTHTGITTSSQAFWDFPTEWFNASGSIFNARITGSGTATIRHCCVVGTCDPAVGTVEVRWFNN